MKNERRRGSALFLVLVMVGALGALALSAIVLTGNATLVGKSYDKEADLRYAGQSFELTVPLEASLAEAFHRAHEERYGYADRDRSVELVAIRTADVRRGPAFDLPRAEPVRVEGPSVLEQSGSTVFIPPGWVGVGDGSSTLRVTRA